MKTIPIPNLIAIPIPNIIAEKGLTNKNKALITFILMHTDQAFSMAIGTPDNSEIEYDFILYIYRTKNDLKISHHNKLYIYHSAKTKWNKLFPENPI